MLSRKWGNLHGYLYACDMVINMKYKQGTHPNSRNGFEKHGNRNTDKRMKTMLERHGRFIGRPKGMKQTKESIEKMRNFLNKLLFFPPDFENKLEFLQTKLAVSNVFDHNVFILFGGLTLKAIREDFWRRAVFTIHLPGLGDMRLEKLRKFLEINLHIQSPFPEEFFLDH